MNTLVPKLLIINILMFFSGQILAENHRYIFVSFSMTDQALKNYYLEAQRLGGTLVMRGLKNNDFLQTKQKAEEIGIDYDIDPNLYEKYQITHVPVIVEEKAANIKKIAGHIPFADALEIMKQEIPEQEIPEQEIQE